MKLKGQIALVTGGGRAIGKAIALRLAGEGADLVICGPDQPELDETVSEIEAIGRRGLAVVADVSREDQVMTMVARARSAFGQIDILVNNAGIIGPTALIPEISRADWDEVLAVNLTGVFLCTKAVLPMMMSRRSGVIVNISSVAGKMGYALRSPYAVSKWGVIGLTLTTAKEMGPYNIRVNAICPGPVDGDRMSTLIESRAAELKRSVDEVTREYTGTTLLGRFVQADDVAAMVTFLVSEEAENVTGQALDVSAGYRV